MVYYIYNMLHYGNGHVNFTNTVIGNMLTKLVNMKWNEMIGMKHVNVVLYAYCTTYKVTIGHTYHFSLCIASIH
jgi:hypothetical protein